MLSLASSPAVVSPQQVAQFDREGYLLVKGLFNPEQVAAIRQRYDDFAARGQAVKGFWEPQLDADPTKDPLKRYPRLMHPHRWDGDFAKRMMLHPGVGAVLQALLREPAVACQSMYYYKPPGARGQALHQDNFYLEVRPGTCIAAWTAIDPAAPENGGMYVVPGSQKLDILCPESADDKQSWTTHLVNPPKGMKAIPAIMDPGDTLFFNGSVIHGSGPNRSTTQWRRSWICHYMPRGSTHVSPWYFPIHDFAGNEIPYQASAGGGPCGEAKKVSSYDPYGA